MQLTQLLAGVPYTLAHGTLHLEIGDLVYDSRKVTPGCVFVCLSGARVDGHSFAAQAAQNGAAAVVAQKEVDCPGATLVLTKDTRYALACMSAAWFGHPAQRLTTVGITGTKGKTTTACMIRAILQAAGIKTGMIGTLGAIWGENAEATNNTTPESYDVQRYLKKMADDGCRCVVMEASSLGLKWHRTAGFVFDYGLFTNFSPDHIGGDEHANLAEYLACKALLFKSCKLGIVNADDAHCQAVLQGHTCQVETFGFTTPAPLMGANEALVSRPGYLGARFDVHGALELAVEVAIPGMFSAYNALAAIAVCRHFAVTQQAIVQGLGHIRVKGRAEPVPVPGDFTLLIDYAHNAVSMENILSTLREYQPHRLICLFGAGGNRPRARRFEMGEICGKLADLSVITADNSRDEDVMDIIADIRVGIDKTGGQYVVEPDRREAIRYCIEHAQPGDIIVLAGKGHETYQEIKGVKHHFDEQEVVADILKSLNTRKED